MCIRDRCSVDQIEDLAHALYYCNGNNGIGIHYIDAVKTFIPNISFDRALLLQFEVDWSMELAIICILAIAWINIWRSRVDGKIPKLSSVKSEMESQILLWRTAHSYDNDILKIQKSKKVRYIWFTRITQLIYPQTYPPPLTKFFCPNKLPKIVVHP